MKCQVSFSLKNKSNNKYLKLFSAAVVVLKDYTKQMTNKGLFFPSFFPENRDRIFMQIVFVTGLKRLSTLTFSTLGKIFSR